MNVKIIIDGTLVYHPQTHTVHALNDEHNRITVAVPASLCLRLLLEKQGIIVSQSKLLDIAWHARGINVSANTLYQNIFLLRKALEKVGGSSTIIRTVPKRGFIISNDTDVTYVDEIPQPALPASIKEETETYTNPQPTPPPAPEVTPPQVPQGVSFKPLRFTIAIMLLFTACTLVTFYLSSRQLPSFSLKHYNVAMRMDGCTIYRNPSMRTDAFFSDFIHYHQLKCGNAKWWYITNNPPSERVSLIQCLAPMDKTPGAEKGFCVSSYYLGLFDRG